MPREHTCYQGDNRGTNQQCAVVHDKEFFFEF